MVAPELKNESWKDEKENLKLKFEKITDKFSMLEETDRSGISEKLQIRLNRTKEAVHKIIDAL